MIDPRDELQHLALHLDHRERILHGPAAANRIAAGIRLEVSAIVVVSVKAVSVVPVQSLRAVVRDADRRTRRRVVMPAWTATSSAAAATIRRDHAGSWSMAPRLRPAAVASNHSQNDEHPERDHDRDRLRRHAEHRRDAESDQDASQHPERQSIAPRPSDSISMPGRRTTRASERCRAMPSSAKMWRNQFCALSGAQVIAA